MTSSGRPIASSIATTSAIAEKSLGYCISACTSAETPEQHLGRKALQFLLEVLEHVKEQLRSLLLVIQQLCSLGALCALIFEGIAHLCKDTVGLLQHVLQRFQLLALLRAEAHCLLQLLDAATFRLQLLVHIVKEALQISQLSVYLCQLLVALLQVFIPGFQLLPPHTKLIPQLLHLLLQMPLQVIPSLLGPRMLCARLRQASFEGRVHSGRGLVTLLLYSKLLPGFAQVFASLCMLLLKRYELFTKGLKLLLYRISFLRVPAGSCRLELTNIVLLRKFRPQFRWVHTTLRGAARGRAGGLRTAIVIFQGTLLELLVLPLKLSLLTLIFGVTLSASCL
jgi:hypothetical protein